MAWRRLERKDNCAVGANGGKRHYYRFDGNDPDRAVISQLAGVPFESLRQVEMSKGANNFRSIENPKAGVDGINGIVLIAIG